MRELLDELTRMAPPERWLPQWGLDDARAYVGAVGGPGQRKWQHSHPPQPPHTYTVRTWRPDLRQEFLAFAQLIQRLGELKTWGGRVDAYLQIDGLEYWTMGARVPETTVINRAPRNPLVSAICRSACGTTCGQSVNILHLVGPHRPERSARARSDPTRLSGSVALTVTRSPVRGQSGARVPAARQPRAARTARR